MHLSRRSAVISNDTYRSIQTPEDRAVCGRHAFRICMVSSATMLHGIVPALKRSTISDTRAMLYRRTTGTLLQHRTSSKSVVHRLSPTVTESIQPLHQFRPHPNPLLFSHRLVVIVDHSYSSHHRHIHSLPIDPVPILAASLAIWFDRNVKGSTHTPAATAHGEQGRSL